MYSRAAIRLFSSASASSQAVFSSSRKLLQRERAASRTNARDYDYVRDEVATRLTERLSDISRAFPNVLDLGGGNDAVLRALLAQDARSGVRALTVLDPSPRALARGAAELDTEAATAGITVERACAPLEGAPLPFNDGAFDLVVSSCALQWVNDVPAVFTEARRVLRPDGVFLAAFLGGETLDELRRAASAAEQERDGGVSPRVSPMMAGSDAGSLLSGAGFALPTVDVDTFSAEYANAALLMEHLRASGESNAALGARGGARRSTLLATAAAYTAMCGGSDGSDSVPATFQIIYLIGWAPASSQPKPVARGSVPTGFGMRKSPTNHNN
jgi:NADH dehydrogenase [ubiquinone] 1 alpha subcomplex assembly factor 5